eukprot:UN01800
MVYDPWPVQPRVYMTAWWQKYRYINGLVTESIAPNRQNVPAMALSSFQPYRLKAGARNVAPLVASLAYFKLVKTQMDELNDQEHRRHWD